MPIDKILEEEINKSKIAVENDIPDEEYANEAYNQALTDLKSRIPQIKERIIKMIEGEKEELKHQSMLIGDDVGYEKAVEQIINTLKGGKDK